MKFAPIALLTTAAALISGPAVSHPGAASSDTTIKTQTTFDGRPDLSQSAVLQVKGSRERETRTYAGSSSPHGARPAVITQCDARRLILVNDQKRLYAISPLGYDRPIRPAEMGWSTADSRPVTATMTVDAVDTGERRTFGGLVARRVVTTTTTERQGEAMATRVQDGWYLDLPSHKCNGFGNAILISERANGRTEVKWKGTARTGWPAIETDRSTDAYGTSVRTTTLVELSSAPLDPALFDVPHGYRAALPIGDGNFDLEKPDTALNRVRHAVESVASWVHYTWSRIGAQSHGETTARRR